MIQALNGKSQLVKNMKPSNGDEIIIVHKETVLLLRLNLKI